MAAMLGLAELGWGVNAYDGVPDRVRKLQQGTSPYREPGLEDVLRTHLGNGRLALCESLAGATKGVEAIVVAVPTPHREDGSTDLNGLTAAIEALARQHLSTWPTVVVISAVPPGTSDRLAELVRGWGELVYAPAFLREGSALHDFLHPDRIVVGSENAAAAVSYVRLLEELQKPVLLTSRASAELIECGSHAFLALKAGFANEIANLCDALSATSDDVLRGIGYDRRIGSQFLSPGLAEPRFEHDVKRIEHAAAAHNMGREIVSATLRVGAEQARRMVELVESVVDGLPGLTIGVWGLVSRAGTDDVRSSRAMRIVECLAERGANVVAYDPAVHVANLPDGSRLVQTALEASDADVLLVLTDWPEFQSISPRMYAARVRRGVVIDGRNALDAERVTSAGLTYRGVGRAVATKHPPVSFASGL